MTEHLKTIQSVERAIHIIDCFTEEQSVLTIGEISSITGLNINTARGLINTLVLHGLLYFDPKRKTYQLGFYFSSKSKLVAEKEDVWIDIAKPYVHMLAHDLQLTSSFQLVQHLRAYTIYSSSSHTANYQIQVSENSILALNATASGKLCLAYNVKPENLSRLLENRIVIYTPKTCPTAEALRENVEAIRERGYSFENQEHQIGVSSIAVPIFDTAGTLIATLSVTTFSDHVESIFDEVLARLRQYAEEIRQAMLQTL